MQRRSLLKSLFTLPFLSGNSRSNNKTQSPLDQYVDNVLFRGKSYPFKRNYIYPPMNLLETMHCEIALSESSDIGNATLSHDPFATFSFLTNHLYYVYPEYQGEDEAIDIRSGGFGQSVNVGEYQNTTFVVDVDQ